MALFKAEDKDNKSFQYMHCWNILRNQPKWHEKRNQLAAQKEPANKKPKDNTDSSPETSTAIVVDSSTNATIENVRPETEAPQRPIGKKKAKEALRRGGGDACMEALDHLWAKKKEFDAEKEKKKEDRYNQSYALEKERLELNQKRAAIEEARVANEAKKLKIKENEIQYKKMVEEERIMSMDITSMPVRLQQYYKSLQDEIMARRVSE